MHEIRARKAMRESLAEYNKIKAVNIIKNMLTSNSMGSMLTKAKVIHDILEEYKSTIEHLETELEDESI